MAVRKELQRPGICWRGNRNAAGSSRPIGFDEEFGAKPDDTCAGEAQDARPGGDADPARLLDGDLRQDPSRAESVADVGQGSVAPKTRPAGAAVRPPIAGAGARALRILLVIESAGGGSGRHVADLAAALLAAGHDVHLIFSPKRLEPGFSRALAGMPNLRATAIPMSQSLGLEDVAALVRIGRYVSRNGPFDVIHAHSSKAGVMVRLLPPRLFASVRLYTPHAFRTLDPELPRIQYLLFGGIEWLLGRYCCDRIIAVSPEEMAHALRLNIPHGRLRLIANGVGAPPRVDRAELRRHLGLAKDDICVGYVGRLTRQKAPERVVAAMSHLKHTHPGIAAVIVGDGELRSTLEAMIRDEGLERRVHLVSSSRGWELMTAFDMLLMPSRYEAMPYVLLEALSTGLPVIATSVSGVSITVRDGENGLIVPNVDRPEPLATAIARLAADPALLCAMAEASRRRATMFQLETMVRKTLDVYTTSRRATVAPA